MSEKEIKERLMAAFDEWQARVLADVIHVSYNQLVKTSDFNELKGIVKDIGVKVSELAEAQKHMNERLGELVEAQKRTDERIGQLTEAQKRTDERIGQLAEAQKRTDERLGQLIEAQERTDEKIGVLAEAQEKTEREVAILAEGLEALRSEVGGLSRGVAYGLENEAYRSLPAIMKEQGIEVNERLVRVEIDGEEINIFGKGRRNGTEVLIVGEAELQSRSVNKINQLLRKAEVVEGKSNYRNRAKVIHNMNLGRRASHQATGSITCIRTMRSNVF